jgi:glycopeptide antibiotics resistance protein
MGETPLEAGEFPGTDAAGRHLRISGDSIDAGGGHGGGRDPDARARNKRGATSLSRKLPRKSTARLLWALFSLFVVYGTTFPFRFNLDWRQFLVETQRINWRLLGGVSGNPIISDIVQNILLFIPFGFLGYFSLIYKRSWINKSGIVLAGAALSASVEFLQIFSSTRYPALSDVVFNTLGTVVGLAAAVALKKSVLGFKSHPAARRFLDAESAFPALVFLILSVAGCLEPFDFSLDVGIFWHHVRPLLEHPLAFARPDDDLISFIRFLLLSLFVCRLAKEAGLRRPVLSGSLLVGAMGVALEACQIIVQSRFPEVQDALVALAGSISGGIVFFFPGFHKRPWPWLLAGVSAVFLSAAARACYPFDFTDHFSGFNWVPFLPRYGRTTFGFLRDFVESAMTFFPIGFLLGYFFPRSRSSALAALIAGVLALAVEAMQGYVPGPHPDITDVLGAMLGGLAGGMVLMRGWPAFRDYMRQDEDRQV